MRDPGGSSSLGPSGKIAARLRAPAAHGGLRQCRRNLLTERPIDEAGNTEIVIARDRKPGEDRPAACDYGCRDGGPCLAEEGFEDDDASADLLWKWIACGGRRRREWPEPGGLPAQDAALVAGFIGIDGLAASAEEAAAKRAEKKR